MVGSIKTTEFLLDTSLEFHRERSSQLLSGGKSAVTILHYSMGHPDHPVRSSSMTVSITPWIVVDLVDFGTSHQTIQMLNKERRSVWSSSS